MREILLLASAYGLGNILTGYLLGKLFYGKNIRIEGSGNAGARNAGRLLGRKAFVLTFLGDALKGAIAVLAAKWIGLPEAWQLFALLAVILGHIYPIIFQCKGGKGMSTLIGGLIAFNVGVFAAFAGCFLLFFLIKRSATLAAMMALSILPILMIIFTYSIEAIIAVFVISLIIVLQHRQNIKEKIADERK